MDIVQKNKQLEGYGTVKDLSSYTLNEGEFGWHPDVVKLAADDTFNILTCKHRAQKLEKMERHLLTKEVIIPIDGDVIVPLSKESSPANITYFNLKKGEVLELNVGVWHFIPFPVENDTNCVVIFKKNTGMNDLEFQSV